MQDEWIGSKIIHLITISCIVLASSNCLQVSIIYSIRELSLNNTYSYTLNHRFLLAYLSQNLWHIVMLNKDLKCTIILAALQAYIFTFSRCLLTSAPARIPSGHRKVYLIWSRQADLYMLMLGAKKVSPPCPPLAKALASVDITWAIANTKDLLLWKNAY